jgi:hypothetical protein
MRTRSTRRTCPTIISYRTELFSEPRSPSHSSQPAHPPPSAPRSPHSRTGSPPSTQYTHRAWRLSQRPSYTRACTEPYSDVWGAHMRRCVRVCVIRGRGMRRRRRCWVRRGLLGALRRCGRFLGSMRRVVRRTRKTDEDGDDDEDDEEDEGEERR